MAAFPFREGRHVYGRDLQRFPGLFILFVLFVAPIWIDVSSSSSRAARVEEGNDAPLARESIGAGSNEVTAKDQPKEVSQRGKSKSELFMRVFPSVVLVKVSAVANVSLPEPELVKEQLEAKMAQLSSLTKQGAMPSGKDAIVNQLVREFSTHARTYIKQGTDLYRTTVAVGATGTGFIVSTDGYVVTNAHVVGSKDSLRSALVRSAWKDALERHSRTLARSFANNLPGVPGLSKDDFAQLVKALMGHVQEIYSEKQVVGEIRKFLIVRRSVPLPDKSLVAAQYEASEVSVGKPAPDKDVAVLKVEATNLPAIPLGDDSQLIPGDDIIIIGFPGLATFNPAFDRDQSPLAATVTSGIVSARKLAKQGEWKWIQTDAAVYHGSSGGPVLDSAGVVVGVTTMITRAASGPGPAQEMVPGMNYLVPVSLVKELLDRFGVKYATVHEREQK